MYAIAAAEPEVSAPFIDPPERRLEQLLFMEGK
jgi:hypothetical protein